MKLIWSNGYTWIEREENIQKKHCICNSSTEAGEEEKLLRRRFIEIPIKRRGNKIKQENSYNPF